MTDKDSVDVRIPPSCPASISQILRHAWHHDLAGLKPLLNVPGRASVQEPTTGETPLHAAIRACGGRVGGGGDDADDDVKKVSVEDAKAVVEELFFSGAIWNDVDSNDETPGDVAARLGLAELYDMCVAAGVRAELLFGLLEGYEEIETDEEEEDEEDDNDEDMVDGPAAANDGQIEQDPEEAPELVPSAMETEVEAEPAAQEEEEDTEIVESNPDRAFVPPNRATDQVNSAEYLRSHVTYTDGKLVDSSQNGVMMAWETSIMRSSVDALLPGLAPGRKILNIGFGMGIIDAMFRETQPSRHHIIEAHPEVLAHIENAGSAFGKDWEAQGPEPGAYEVHAGRWQDVLPKLLDEGMTYDAIYFDTFGEDYSQLRTFFTDYVPGLLEEEGRFGFFNGLGADRQICYDVYTKVVEMHLSDAGMDVEWQEFDVDMKDLQEEGRGEWEGVKRRYWTLNKYRLPTCTFMG